MVGWHHQCNGREFAQALGDGEGQGSLACCSPWTCTKSLSWLSCWTTNTSIWHNFFLLRGLRLIFLLVHIILVKVFFSFCVSEKISVLPFGFWKIFLLGMKFWLDSFFSVNAFKDVAPLSSDYIVRNGKVPIILISFFNLSFFFNPSGCFLDFLTLSLIFEQFDCDLPWYSFLYVSCV